MVAIAERLRLESDSSDRKNLVGSQIIPDRLRYRTTNGAVTTIKWNHRREDKSRRFEAA